MAKAAKEDAKATNVSPQDIQQCARELDAIDDKVETLSGQRRALRKRWKTDGIPLAAVDRVRADKRKDLADVVQAERDYQFAAAALSLDLSNAYQATLDFDIPAEAKESQTKYDTHRQGYEACKRGDPRSANLYDAGTISFASWDAGWSDYSNDEFNGAGPKDAEPGKPARKPKKGAGAELGPQPPTGETIQ